MKYFKFILSIGYVYFGLVTLLNTLQQGGSGQWHYNVFGQSNPIILDWWLVIIPSIIITALIARYTDSKTQTIFFYLFTGLVVFLIVGTYL
ncbi:MAG: hypothetical protein ACKKL4_02820 [Patescibacteria group bacterium]